MDSQEPPRDDFEDFRNRCGCVVRDISLLLSGPECFTIMFNTLQNEAAMGWDRTEAILWILSSIAPQVDRKQDCPAVPGKNLIDFPRLKSLTTKRYTIIFRGPECSIFPPC